MPTFVNGHAPTVGNAGGVEPVTLESITRRVVVEGMKRQWDEFVAAEPFVRLLERNTAARTKPE